MQLILSKHSGFCAGVKRAVSLAEAAAAKDGKAYTVGRLIHNAEAVADLEKCGVIAVNNASDVPEGAVAVIRSHGAPPSDYEALTARGVRIVDATCPSVAAIHNKVSRYSEMGYYIIIVGEANHPEVRGTLGRCKSGGVAKPGAPYDLQQEYDKILVVAQTTIDPAAYAETSKIIAEQAKINAKSVEFLNTICYTTIVRQKSAESIAKVSEAVFVIGDPTSGNTNTLVGICKRYCPATYLISNVSGVEPVADKINGIKNISKLGVVASASAPQRLIMEVINRMDQENKVDTIVIDDAIPSTEEVKAAEEAETPAESASTDAAVEAEATTESGEPASENAEQPAAPQAQPKTEKHDEPMTMEKAMKHYAVRSYREGMKVKARVISVDPTGLSVAVEGLGKNDSGFIDKDEIEIDGSFNPDNYEVGKVIEAVIIAKSADSKTKGINLSKKAYDIIKVEDEAVKKILEGEEFSLVCNQAIKGGLLGHIGSYTVFVPASQIRMGYVKTLEDYVGKKLRLRVLPPKELEASEAEEGKEDEPKRRSNPKRIVAGQREILEEERKAREEAFWEVMQVNNIIKGKVKRFTPFGAFVSIMNFDCLAHISDLSWTKINDPSEVLEINKSYDFVVIKVDRENGKVSLGYKQLQKKPYELAAEKYHVGDIVKGKVERIKDFGAFIEIEPGIDGLVHVSEIGYKWIANANEALKIGEEVEAKIIGFENNKITLSIKQLLPPPTVETIEVTETEASDKPSRASRFNKRMEGADSAGRDKKDRRPRHDKDDSDEPREWVSTPGGATFADLFKDLDFNNFDSKDEE